LKFYQKKTNYFPPFPPLEKVEPNSVFLLLLRQSLWTFSKGRVKPKQPLDDLDAVLDNWE
jgi:hypothetical protein